MILSKKFTAICLTAFMVVFSGFNSLYAQNSTAKGTVVDQNGEPVIGASVMVKGTANGTTTNIDGAFTIADVKEGTTIEASFLGYVSTEAVWNGAVLKLVLQEDTATLDEVVVTALGMKKSAKALGYAMTELKEGQFNPNLINPVSQLQGKVAGVEINSSDGGMFGSTKILIRGASTLNANNQPIYVVDGIILDNAINNSSADWDTSSNDYGNELKNLNPDDFESVSVLKGAAATALYGSRGLNGAVVITTKSGKGSKGLGVSFTQTLGIDAVTSQPTFQNIYQEGAFAGYGTQTLCPTDYDIHNSRLYSDKGNFISYPKVYDAEWNGESFGNRFDSSEYLEYYDGQIIKSKANASNLKDMYDTGFNTNTNVAISGANEKGNFYLSLSEKYVKGTIPNNTFNRFSVLAKASRKISKDVELEVSTTFTNSKPRNAQQNFGDMFCNGGGFDRAYDPTYYRDKYKGEHGGLASTAYGDEYGKVPGRSIWWSIYENNTEQKETVVRPVVKLTVDFTPWMKWVTEGSYNYYYKRLETMNKGTGYANQGTDNGSGGYYRLAQTTKEQTNLNTNFLFNFDFNENWSFNGFLRGEYFENYQMYLSENTDGGLVIPNQFFLANSRNGIQSTGNISATKKMFSVAAQAMVSYKNQLFLEVTGRNDWSSTLVYADGHGTFSYFYPSVSGSWILSETFKMPKAISFMKLRASFAQVGNDTQPYLINSAYSLNTYTKNSQKVNALSIPNTTYSTDLKPEIKTSWEVGLDYRMFNNRIGLDFAYYRENTRNQIMTVSVPSVSGVSNALINAGNIQNSGFEIALNTIPVETRDWTWNLNFTYTKNNSKIVELSDLVGDYITLQGNADYGNYRIASVAKVGGTYGMLMSDSAAKKDYTYDANGNITGGSGLPVITWREGERTAQYVRNGKVEEVGNSTPDFLGSINTSLRFKNWTLGISLDGRFGGYVASFGSRYGTANGYTRTSLQYCDEEHGGITYTSKFDGVTYHDGVIPDAIFMTGTPIKQPDGTTYTVQSGATSSNGETYRELFEKGLIEPSHASSYTFRQSAWSTGVINDNWFTKLNYIALRDISLTYRFPERIANRIKASNLSLMFNAHNVCYLLNTMPNGENPESVRGTAASEFRIRTFEGVTSSFTLTLKASF